MEGCGLLLSNNTGLAGEGKTGQLKTKLKVNGGGMFIRTNQQPLYLPSLCSEKLRAKNQMQSRKQAYFKSNEFVSFL